MTLFRYGQFLIHSVCVLGFSLGQSQAPVFKYLRESDGLNNNHQWSSNALHIDEHGFVWIATTGGLNRYDGYHIKSFNGSGAQPYDLPYNRITAITQDRFGRLWLGTLEEGIILYNPSLETFEHFQSETRLPDSLVFTQINMLDLDVNGDLLIATAFQGLFKYFIQSDSLIRMRLDKEDRTNRSINFFLRLKNESLLIVSYNGLYLENADREFDHYPVEASIFLHSAVELPDGTIRVYSSNQPIFVILNPETKRHTIQRKEIEQPTCTAFIDAYDNLWLSSHNGFLSRENLRTGVNESFPAFVDVRGIRQDICIRTILPDAYGNLYYSSLATGAGRFNVDPLPYTFVEPQWPALFQIDDENLFLTRRDSLLHLENGQLSLIPLQANTKADIYDFLIGNNGDYWISYSDEPPILAHYDTNGILIEQSESVRLFSQMLQLQDGRMTVGNKPSTHDDLNRPYHFIGTHYESLSKKSYPDFRAKYYTQLNNGDIWIATFANGLLRITENFTSYDFLPIDERGNGKLNSNNPYYIFESRLGNILVCTDKGINVWNPATESFTYLIDPDVNLQEIEGMVEVEDGVIWMLMQHQLCRYQIKDHGFMIFDLHPDFRAELQEPGDLQLDQNGLIYYQGAYGIVKVDPNRLIAQRPPHNVLFTELFVDRKTIYPGDNYQLLDSSILYQHSLAVPFEYRDLGFAFVSPHGQDVSTKYFYRLKGYRDDWQDAPTDRTVHFTSLAPGKYNFEVRAQSGTGQWTAETASVSFRIAAPWYQRWWAYVFYALIISSLAYVFYRYRVNQLLKYQKLRTKISSDLHDDVGSILSSIAMESEMLSYQSDPEKAPLLRRLSSLSREAMGRMRDTVWAIDSRKDDLEFLVDRMKDYLAETLSRSKFSSNFQDHTNIANKHISPDLRQNVYLIFKEAINNVLKHSNGQQVDVTLTQEKSRIVLTIKDDGTVTKPINSSGLGLSNMKLRAAAIQADIKISTTNGFEVMLRFDI